MWTVAECNKQTHQCADDITSQGWWKWPSIVDQQLSPVITLRVQLCVQCDMQLASHGSVGIH